jgi:hypothetical protein
MSEPFLTGLRIVLAIRDNYGLNNPSRYTDPSGHKPCDDEFGNCLKPPSKKIKPPQSPKPPTNGSSWRRDNLLSEGIIYTGTSVIPVPQVRGAWLASKAEASYDQFGTLPGLSFTRPSGAWGITVASNGASIASDFYNDFDRYPIATEISWQLREAGLLIDDLEVKNYSPSQVRLDRVKISTILGYTDIPGPQTVVGTNGGAPGVIEMDVNFRISQALNTTMEIRFTSVPSFPDHPYIQILIPAGVIPPPGCSIP